MHARTFRRNFSDNWRRISLIAALAILFQVGLLIFASSAHAEINVSVFNVVAEQSYQSNRVYAGRTAATRAAELGFKRGGEITEMQVDQGDVVAKGDTLAKLDTASINAQLTQAAAEVSLARANLEALVAEAELATNTEQRFRTLREQGHASVQVYDETRLTLRAKQAQLNVARANLERALAAQKSVEVELREAVIRAPFPGTIQARYVDEGTQIRSGEAALRLVEDAHREAHVGIPADIAKRMMPGQTYQVSWQNQTYAASLDAVLPEVDPATRTLTAVFTLAGIDIPLGSTVEVAINEAVDAPGFWLPLSALTEADRGLWGVYVVNAEQIVERRLIEIVHSEADRVFVRGTLKTDDRVVATGVQRIVPGQVVNPVAITQVSYAG
ncbi:MAG: efflux RND transporter periplasmic adaptor subunit [Pseudomonadales bacterium]|nr:efflux RND transporter periplasmic adaptor subunit [Pseudomonadales bacterium]